MDWGLYAYGFFGSIIDVIGSFFANCAIATRSPVGPIFALTDTQMMIITIVHAFGYGMMPHWMQIVGLVFGLIGASILT
jgi:drug/metabolite transporter (DMT)-like permease